MINSLHKPYPDRKLNVCAYARISNNKESLEGSLDTQISYYTDLILTNPEWEYAGLYADDGISGTTTNRPQFQKMIEKAKSGFIDIILVKSVSRFARNLIDLLQTIKEIKKYGVEVIFEKENLSTLDIKCEQMLTIYAKFAEEEAISVSENVKWRNQKNRQDGIYYFPSNLMGYTKDEKNNIVIDETKAVWIRKIYEMYVNNKSYIEIIDELESNNVLTPMGNRKWNRNSIKAILTNEKYVGDCMMQKEYIDSPLNHKKITNHGEKEKYLVQNGHPAIVDRETWNMAQQIREDRAIQFKAVSGPRQNKVTPPNFDYSRFAYCPYCGHMYVTKVNHYNGEATRRYLLCSSNRYNHTCNEGETVFIDVLNIVIMNLLNYLKENSYEFKKALIESFRDPDIFDKSKEVKLIIAQLTKYREKYDSLTNKNDDFSERQKKELTQRISDLTKEKSLLENELLICESPEMKAQKILHALNEIPDRVSSISEVNFRSIFSYMIVKSRNELIFVIGSSDVSKVDIRKQPLFKQTLQYRIRKTNYTCSFGIQIVR